MFPSFQITFLMVLFVCYSEADFTKDPVPPSKPKPAREADLEHVELGPLDNFKPNLHQKPVVTTKRPKTVERDPYQGTKPKPPHKPKIRGEPPTIIGAEVFPYDGPSSKQPSPVTKPPNLDSYSGNKPQVLQKRPTPIDIDSYPDINISGHPKDDPPSASTEEIDLSPELKPTKKRVKPPPLSSPEVDDDIPVYKPKPANKPPLPGSYPQYKPRPPMKPKPSIPERPDSEEYRPKPPTKPKPQIPESPEVEAEFDPQRPPSLGNEYIKTTEEGINFVASVELKSTNEHICVGTVMSPYIVLSSFDCATHVGSSAEKIQIRVGSTNAEEGGYVYEVFEFYGIHYGNAKQVPKKETWGATKMDLHEEREDLISRKSFRKEAKINRKSLNKPKNCEKSSEINPFRHPELFEAERFLKKVNADYLVLITCEPIERSSKVGYAQSATYHGPFRGGNSFIFSFSKENGQLQRTMMTNQEAPLCARSFVKAYDNTINKGVTLENNYVCVTDSAHDYDPSTRDSGFCDSKSGAPIFINFHGAMLFQGVAVYARTCSDYRNPVVIRIFDNRVSRALSQILYA